MSDTARLPGAHGPPEWARRVLAPLCVNDPWEPTWRAVAAARLLHATTSGMRDTWRYIAKANPAPRDRDRLIESIVVVTDTVPELVMDDATDAEIAAAIGLTLADVGGDHLAYKQAIRDQRPRLDLPTDPRPKRPTPRDPQATLARRLLKNLRTLWYLAPRESRAASQPYVQLYSSAIENLAAAFDAAREAARLPWAPAAAAAHLVTHRRWTHLGWRQHRRAVDRLRPLIARDARILASVEPGNASWLERVACWIEAIPAAEWEHAGWIEMEPKASALLWARALDAAMCHSREPAECAAGYLRWVDFAVISETLFGTNSSAKNAPKLIGAAVRAQRAHGPSKTI